MAFRRRRGGAGRRRRGSYGRKRSFSRRRSGVRRLRIGHRM